MNRSAGQPAPGPAGAPRSRWAGRGQAVLALALVTIAGATFAAYHLSDPSRLGPEQPIPFSHRFHVSEKRLSCVFCHTGAARADHAGLPSLETCMLCHSRIIMENPHIRRLRERYDGRKPLAWARVNEMPGFVFFSHEAHVRLGFDCGRCHGDVAGMDRLVPVPKMTMGFCVQCHREHQASNDCLTCHR